MIYCHAIQNCHNIVAGLKIRRERPVEKTNPIFQQGAWRSSGVRHEKTNPICPRPNQMEQVERT
jgi:hypothetical protein